MLRKLQTTHSNYLEASAFFCLEAKKPSVAVKDEIQPAYQLRRYGWSAKMPISLITDFEEFAVYDCTKKPSPTDKASTGRIRYITYKDYIKEFDFLWDTFSKERVLKGGFDKFIANDTAKKGTATVDKEFLLSLDEWRTRLAITISKRNPDLDEDELNFVVQQTLDRIIFLRIAEDRKVEEYGNLKNAVKTSEAYANLLQLFQQADSKYNSGLFDFRKDKISKKIDIDSKTVKSIIDELYFPVSPYEFSVLSVEILGSAYEQFLGKQITLDKNHRAKIEEKPEVRKAGGVYYTPQYIVDYIVENTVGKQISGKTPKEVAKIKIVDPSCGSGSFLLGAYQFLLNWHHQYYKPEFERLTEIAASPEQTTKQRTDAVKERAKLPLTPDGNLTTQIKKEILLNNIYGVDLDVNAVEVTKLSLLLKCMEGETQSSLTATLSFGERVLPTLDNNIKSGNSLVDLDFYDSQIDFGEEKKIKPFSWEQAFPTVFNQGGFDAVIGNPPYVRQELLGVQKEYFSKKYNVYHGMADLYSYFFEKGIGLLNKNGLFGIIVANKWMKANYGEPLRHWLRKQSIHQIVDFGDLPVFQGAIAYPCIIISEKGKKPETIQVANLKTLNFDNLGSYINESSIKIPADQLSDDGWNLISPIEERLFKKLQQIGMPLGEYVKGKIYRGVLTGLNEAFVIDAETRKRLITEDPKSAELIKPFLAGRDIKRYQEPVSDKYLILIPKGFTNEYGHKPAKPWLWLSKTYPSIASHLAPFEQAAEKRYDKGEYWWELRACEYYNEFENPKIIIPAIVKSASYTWDNSGFYSNDKTSIIPTGDKYLLGLLNSKVLDYFLKKIASTKQNGYFEYKPMYVTRLPIKILDKETQIEVIKNVDQILLLQKELLSCRLESKKDQVLNQIVYCEKKIDQLVFKIYGLNRDEINVIEQV